MANKLLFLGSRYENGDRQSGFAYGYYHFRHGLKTFCENRGWEFCFFDCAEATLRLGGEFMSMRLLEKARRESPFLVFAFPGNSRFDPDYAVLRRISHSVCPVCIWIDDDAVETIHCRASCADWICTARGGAARVCESIGLKDRVIRMPYGACPDICKPYDFEKDLDVTFIGTAGPDRFDSVKKLREAGLSPFVFGKGWPHGTRLPWRQMFKTCAMTRVNLNLARVGQECINKRVYEITMSGNFLLTGRVEGMEKSFIPGQEIETFGGTEEMIDKIRFFLGNKDAAGRIAKKGMERARADHTWEQRFETIWETCVTKRRAAAGSPGGNPANAPPSGISFPEGPAAREGLSFIVITGGNRENKLTRLMKSIRLQNIPEYEILVIGNYREGPHFTYIAEREAAANGQLGKMRNRGMANARFGRRVILDDDFILDPGWYQSLLRYPLPWEILTGQILVPDGSRYWDHATFGGARGHMMLNPDETDDSVYMSGGCAWLLSKKVSERMRYDEARGFYQNEDTEFAAACRKAGFTIKHDPELTAWHDDPVYTQVGRAVCKRSKWKDLGAAFAALAALPPERLARSAEDCLRAGAIAEAADCLRTGVRRYPGIGYFFNRWQWLQNLHGGELRDVRWSCGNSPEYLKVVEWVEKSPDP